MQVGGLADQGDYAKMGGDFAGLMLSLADYKHGRGGVI